MGCSPPTPCGEEACTGAGAIASPSLHAFQGTSSVCMLIRRQIAFRCS
ncbi:hypothetical protein e1012e08.tmp0355 [Eimeria tenella]|uniref:Uncharacterized protein n=1 Tax=Eimeria tenella TaxID=5802 RepID=C8TDN3_EIMTE|nr:hypothetical protein e1012e08.tmp0355 [Eimeria tenella]